MFVDVELDGFAIAIRTIIGDNAWQDAAVGFAWTAALGLGKADDAGLT